MSAARVRSRARRTRRTPSLGPIHSKKNPSQTKENQGNRLGFSWINLDYFVRFRTFQRVTGNPTIQGKKMSTPSCIRAPPPPHYAAIGGSCSLRGPWASIPACQPRFPPPPRRFKNIVPQISKNGRKTEITARTAPVGRRSRGPPSSGSRCGRTGFWGGDCR